MDAVSFGISAAMAHLLTNIDNLAIMAGLILSSGRWRVVGCYLVAQAIVLGVALKLGESLGEQLTHTGYLGFVPILIGIGALWRRIRMREEAEGLIRTQMSVLAIVAMFLSVSVDSFVIFAPILAESGAVYRTAAMMGAVVSAVGLAVVALAVSQMTGTVLSRVVKLDRLAPYVMIAVGFYVLINTGTDTS